jgi:hypothetical protein
MKRNPLLTSSRAYLTAIALVMTLTGGSIGCTSYTTGLQKSAATADETSVVSALRTIALAEQSHAATNEGNFATFPELNEGGYLDSRFNSDAPEMHGYVLTMKLGEKAFSCNADPVDSGEKRGRHFYVDSSSPIVRVNATQAASARDGVLQF